jgi:hypothetical protein
VLSPAPRFREALEILARHEVDFIVVGGVAAVLAGAPISTFDLDIVHARDAANLERLVAALQDLDARYRDPGGRLLRPDAAALDGEGHHLLMTRCGPLDVLGRIGAGDGYDELFPDTIERSIGDHAIRVLNLPALIRTKTAAARPKDHAVLAILRRTLDESSDEG